MSQRIRIKLKSYDYNLVDKSAEKIVKTVKPTGAVVSGPIPLPTEKKSTRFYVHHTLTKKHVSNSNCVLTNVCWISIHQTLKRLTH